MSHSQNNEETIIAQATASIKAGRFIDIGAYDGSTFSNTLALAKRGWSGVLVEPGQEAFSKLRELHDGNDKLALVRAAVGCDSGIVQFWDCGDLYSTTEAANLKKWKDYCKTHDKPFKFPYFVPQLSPSDLLGKFSGPYDVLSIDTEGTSVQLFSAFMRIMYADPPKVIAVEHDGLESACVSVVGARYEVAESNTENIVFVRRERP